MAPGARIRLASLFAVAAVTLVACGGDDTTSSTELPAAEATDGDVDSSGVRVVSAEEAAGIVADAPDGLVVLDVRTPEEFAEGRLEGALNIDIYRDDFAETIDALDRDIPYVLYCRSGNRSQQARMLMDEFGFGDVADVDGGIVAWVDAGLPVVTS